MRGHIFDNNQLFNIIYKIIEKVSNIEKIIIFLIRIKAYTYIG